MKHAIVKLTRPELDHLLTLLRINESEGYCYGPQARYWARHDRLVNTLGKARIRLDADKRTDR